MLLVHIKDSVLLIGRPMKWQLWVSSDMFLREQPIFSTDSATHGAEAIALSSQCSTAGVTKAMVCAIHWNGTCKRFIAISWKD